ncbi:Helix-hairpin-helix motif,Helix-turn-helix, base-excision DNA repair, C-terminal,DNA glycosylase,HhH-GPD [Cinara cedri]|uniref:N-glycosylase/DNA lyase n=1 Tax=Cinara cedri TaxID=506608 RepID=A0A5E4LY10_9HEMI|nr:Helix-hairpin-helix motif,Helix-turn-helix, base-excision DNA repair, C-terminal,DNA glycosylase,HhH-GPD [Cinara cedri]
MKKLVCTRDQVNLKCVLLGGQSFRWKETAPNEYSGVFSGGFWVLQQNDDHINFKRTPATNSDEQSLSNYLRMNEPLDLYYKEWSICDPIFKKSAERFKGIRMLKQEPIENILSFICSSNNNIIRISSMVEKMCTLYGDKIEGTDIYAFPNIDQLVRGNIEEDLKNAKFGYRAKFISQTAEKIFKLDGIKWIEKLKNMDYDNAKKELMLLPGVGPKVADCICLMSLDHLEAVPVDTHVFQIARENYLPHLKKYKSVTQQVYNEIGDCFRKIFKKNAGWAHTVLFLDDLKTFKANESNNDKLNEKPKAKKKKKI